MYCKDERLKMKKFIISLAVAGLIINSDCFAMEPSLSPNDENNSRISYQEIKKTAGSLCATAAAGAVTGTAVATCLFSNNIYQFAPYAKALWTLSKLHIGNSLIGRIWNRLPKITRSFAKINFKVNIINSVEKKLTPQNIAYFAAAYAGVTSGTELASYLVSPSSYQFGLSSKNLWNETKSSAGECWNQLPRFAQILIAYRVISQSIKSCTGHEIKPVSTLKWILNQQILNRALLWTTYVPMYVLMYGLEKFQVINDKSDAIEGLVQFFDETPLGDLIVDTISDALNISNEFDTENEIVNMDEVPDDEYALRPL